MFCTSTGEACDVRQLEKVQDIRFGKIAVTPNGTEVVLYSMEYENNSDTTVRPGVPMTRNALIPGVGKRCKRIRDGGPQRPDASESSSAVENGAPEGASRRTDQAGVAALGLVVGPPVVAKALDC